MPTPAPVLHWFRRDLRLADNPALCHAIEQGRPVIPLFIHAPKEEAPWAPGAASRWWLHHALERLAEDLAKRGSRLVIRQGSSLDELRALCAETGASLVTWNRLYDPATVARDTAVKTALRASGIEAVSFNAALLHEPWTIATGEGGPYKVFTPFWKRCLAEGTPPEPLAAPRKLVAPTRWPESLSIGALGLLPTIRWDGGLAQAWSPGEKGATAALRRFLDGAVESYDVDRDRPDLVGTSRLSPHLHFGEIGPRQVWHAVRQKTDPRSKDTQRFLAEVGWREFAHHLLFHFPTTPEAPLRPEFARFPWRRSEADLEAWQRGRTGYPIVDAGMRELWTTGWMHNRVRMIVASFLVKHLLLPWQEGARWFWDTLVDADLANNTLGWQWTAGCGADAAPYFRIFNPILQGAKFDPSGAYVRRWVPELAGLPDAVLFKPWEASPATLAAAGVRLGANYPHPIVDHAAARARALGALERMGSKSA
jgi:deoxyribodipyrimidine photo-lyase